MHSGESKRFKQFFLGRYVISNSVLIEMTYYV